MAGDKSREEKRPHIRVIKEVIIVLGVSLVSAGLFVFQVINWLAKDSADYIKKFTCQNEKTVILYQSLIIYHIILT